MRDFLIFSAMVVGMISAMVVGHIISQATIYQKVHSFITED